jgi:hypothetical protein
MLTLLLSISVVFGLVWGVTKLDWARKMPGTFAQRSFGMMLNDARTVTVRVLQERTLNRMFASVVVGVSGRAVAPTTFSVGLASEDYELVRGMLSFFVSEIVAMFESQVRRRGWVLTGALLVNVSRDDLAELGRPCVVASFHEATVAFDEEPQVTLAVTAAMARVVATDRAWVLNERAQTLFGRATDTDILVDDSKASRRHAEIVYGEGRWMIRDLESLNGTKVNGRRIAASVPVTLNDGDTITMGQWSATFQSH